MVRLEAAKNGAVALLESDFVLLRMLCSYLSTCLYLSGAFSLIPPSTSLVIRLSFSILFASPLYISLALCMPVRLSLSLGGAK